MTKRGLFLDFDGTLIESMHLIKQAYYKTLEMHGKAGSDEEFHALAGPPTRIYLENISKKYNLSVPFPTLEKQYDGHIKELYQDITPLPHALDLIKIASSHNCIVGIVTSNNRDLVENWIKENALGSSISFIIDGETGGRGKPNPDPYLKALEISGCTREHSFAVEDSLTGVRSALSAGLPTIFLAPHLSCDKQEELKRSSPLLKIVSNLKEVIALLK